MILEHRPVAEAAVALPALGTSRLRGSSRLVYVLALLAILLGTVGSIGSAEAGYTPPPKRLGGFDLTWDCRKYYGDPEAIAVATEYRYAETGWHCAVHGKKTPVTLKLLNKFAVLQYGKGAYARQDGSKRTDWRAYRNAVRLGGFNLTEDCRWYHRDANARARYADINNPHSWVCVSRGVTYPLDLKLFARHEHGSAAFPFLVGKKATDWAAFRY